MTTAATPTLSSKATDLIQAIVDNPNNNAAHIAEVMGVSVGTVTGGLASLKKANLVTVEEGLLVPTEEAVFFYGTATTEGTTEGATETPAVKPFFPSVESVRGSLTATTTTVVEGDTEGDTEGDDATVETGSTDTTPVAEAPAKAKMPKAVKEPKAPKVPNTDTKAHKAREVFEANKDKSRKELMALLTAPEIGLTSHGANTYIYNMRKKAGMVTPREAVAIPGTGDAAKTEASTDATTTESAIASDTSAVLADVVARAEAITSETPADEVPAAIAADTSTEADAATAE